MLLQISITLGIFIVALVFIHFTLVRPMKRFFVEEVITSLTAIRDSIDRNTASMVNYPGAQSLNGNPTSSITK